MSGGGNVNLFPQSEGDKGVVFGTLFLRKSRKAGNQKQRIPKVLFGIGKFLFLREVIYMPSGGGKYGMRCGGIPFVS